MDEYMKCPECGEELEHKCVFVFGDESLGIQDEWLTCPNCGWDTR